MLYCEYFCKGRVLQTVADCQQWWWRKKKSFKIWERWTQIVTARSPDRQKIENKTMYLDIQTNITSKLQIWMWKTSVVCETYMRYSETSDTQRYRSQTDTHISRQTGGPSSNQEQTSLPVSREADRRYVSLDLHISLSLLFCCLHIRCSPFLPVSLLCPSPFFVLPLFPPSVFPWLCPWWVPASQGTVPAPPDEDQAVCPHTCVCALLCSDWFV